MEKDIIVEGSRTYNNNPYDKKIDTVRELSIGFRKMVHTAMRAGFEYDIAESLRQELAKMEEADRLGTFPRFSSKRRKDTLVLIKALGNYKKHV
jgi:hypothetical protein